VITLANEKIKAVFLSRDYGLCIDNIENLVAGRRITLAEAGLALVTGKDNPVIVTQKDMKLLDVESSLSSITQVLEAPAEALRLGLTYTLEDFTLKMRLSVRNEGPEDVYLKDLVLFYGTMDAEVEGLDNEKALSDTNPDPLCAPVCRRIDAQPIFIEDHAFCGIDWPVAQNAVTAGGILCRQFAGDSLKPGDRFDSRTFSIGVSLPGKARQAFLSHLRKLRGRETRRASFYFDWLTHASEGPTENEISKQLDLFDRLRSEFGIKFDIYAVDDGAVETRWGLTFELYRLQHDRLYPGGMATLARRAGELGMDFGMWIGPDGFGRNEEQAQERIETITKMVRDWNIGLIKMDTCVSVPLGNNPYENEHYMRKLERLTTQARRENPDLIIINHRITSSPYILTLLDSTLWGGAESYPDVYLLNSDRPRLFTRYASYGRGEPTYYGVYSELLEDHGICFNGDHHGWAEELAVQTFGRSLMLSPEIYGTLFLLPDSEYPELGRLMRLAEEKRSLLSNTKYLAESGDFLHCDGKQALLCLINDSWEVNSRTVTIDERIGLNQGNGEYTVTKHFPCVGNESGNSWHVSWGEDVAVKLRPFGVCILEISPGQALGNCVPLTGPILTLPQDKMEKGSVFLGSFAKQPATDAAATTAERVRFCLSNDPPEAQVLSKLPASRFAEVNSCRLFFKEKLRNECYGVAANAWDDDPVTAWGDVPLWKQISNVWRLDLGNHYRVDRVEVTLADTGPGPVSENGQRQRLEEPVVFEVSPDGARWFSSRAVIYYRRQAIQRQYVNALIAEFPQVEVPVRYVRMHVHGILVSDIRVREKVNGRLVEVPRDRWHGNNLFTARKPRAVFSAGFAVDDTWNGRYLAVTARLPGEISVPLKQEVAVAWVESDKGDFWPITSASPMFPFHGWESNGGQNGNAWTFWIPLNHDMAGKELVVSLAWFGPEITGARDSSLPLAEVSGYIVAAG